MISIFLYFGRLINVISNNVAPRMEVNSSLPSKIIVFDCCRLKFKNCLFDKALNLEATRKYKIRDWAAFYYFVHWGFHISIITVWFDDSKDCWSSKIVNLTSIFLKRTQNYLPKNQTNLKLHSISALTLNLSALTHL